MYIDALIVAGGGAGGIFMTPDGAGGGGGAGGLIFLSNYLLTIYKNYSVVVGDGGTPGLNGGNSSFNDFLSIGGGRGGPGGANGINGGSGGGSGGHWGVICTPGTGIVGQGNNGAPNPNTNIPWPAGGGGGAGSTVLGGPGGLGLSYNIDGTLKFYAAGGGGASAALNSYHLGYSGGSGIGGHGGGGAASGAINGTNGVTNTGSGGGGAGGSEGYFAIAGSGASGIVIIKYSTLENGDGLGGVITHVGGYTIHTFLVSGTFVPPTFKRILRDYNTKGIIISTSSNKIIRKISI